MKLTSNEPFWLVKNGLLHTYPSLKKDEKCDVLIIGAGITGSLIAHQCIKDGFSTILIDKREICNGSTSATTSMLQYEIDVPLYKLQNMIGEENANKAYKSCEKSIFQLEKLVKEIKSKAGFKLKNSLYFAGKKSQVKDLKKEFDARKKAGFAVQWLSPEEIFKQFQVENTFGGILSDSGASVDAFMLSHDIIAYNVKKGLRVFDKTKIENVEYNNDYNLAQTESENTIIAKKIIYCIGYESTEIIKDKFVNLKSTYAIVSEVQPEKFNKQKNTLFWNMDAPYLYMRTTDDGRLLIGGGDIRFKNEKIRNALLGRKKQEIEDVLHQVFPHFHMYTDFVWAGTFGETKDGLPYIGEHPDFPNSYFVLGFGGNGITFSVSGMEMSSYFLKNKLHPLTEIFKFRR